MENLIIYTGVIIWIVFAVLSGFVEANMFHKNTKLAAEFKEKHNFDIHILFNTVRFIFGLIVITTIFLLTDIIEAVYCTLNFICMFPFFHDGAYYYRRNKLSKNRIYKKKWFDQSRSTSATFSLGSSIRLFLLILSFFFLPY